MARPFLSVIIPARNEASRLPLTLIDVDRHLSTQEFGYEIIVAVSPSTDATAEIARRFQSFVKNMRTIALPENKGKGAAIIAGMQAAKGTWKLYMDADNSTSVVEFNKFMPYLRQGGVSHETYDVVIGSRFVKGSHREPGMPVHRHAMSTLGRALTAMLVVHGIHDPYCGFKCFSAEAVDKLLPLAKTTGPLFDLELLALAQREGMTIKEVPVFWSHDGRARQMLNHTIEALIEGTKLATRTLFTFKNKSPQTPVDKTP